MTNLWIDALARTLMHSLWEGAAAALALAVAFCFLRSPRGRYAAGCAAMLVVLCGLLVTFTHLVPEPMVRPLPVQLARAPEVANDTALPPAPMEPLQSDKLGWLVVVWMAGVLVFHLRGVMSWMAARRLRRTGVCVASGEWQERLIRLSARLGLTDPVALWESCLADVPLVVGYVRPVILMPVGLLAGLPIGQVEAILLHELAHIRRYDYLVNLAQVFVEGLLFYHPAVWWISGVIRREREHCCDDLAVAMTGGALEYATALTALEQRRFDTTAALAATGGSLVKRVQRVLGRPEPRYAGAMPVFTAALLALGAGTAVMALQVGSDSRGTGVEVEKRLMAQADQPPIFAPSTDIQPYSQQVAQADKILFDNAARYIQQGEFDAARGALNALINNYPESDYGPKAKFAIAGTWREQGGVHGWTQAVAEYSDFIRFYPDTPEATWAQMWLNLPYNRWLREDVVYLISSEERNAFLQLRTDEEREKFVEQFWLRRDPTPGTEENEFKEEHYRRIAYANYHFGYADHAGWRSDRGRIYIQFGPPDEIEAHDLNGLGAAAPFEDWRYRYIEGFGQNIVIEFVDSNKNGEFRTTMDPGIFAK